MLPGAGLALVRSHVHHREVECDVSRGSEKGGIGDLRLVLRDRRWSSPLPQVRASPEEHEKKRQRRQGQSAKSEAGLGHRGGRRKRREQVFHVVALKG